jgi:hypothetical protein
LTRLHGIRKGRREIPGYVFTISDEKVDRMKGRVDWLAHCWSLTYDGRRIVRTVMTFTIRKFEGVKPITSLPVFPSSYLDSTDGGKTQSRLEELDEKYYKLLRESPEHSTYYWSIFLPSLAQAMTRLISPQEVLTPCFATVYYTTVYYCGPSWDMIPTVRNEQQHYKYLLRKPVAVIC